MLDAMPRALVARLFLAPHQLGRFRIRGDLRRKVIVRKRVKLFDADDRHVIDVFGATGGYQVVINFTAACDDAAYRVGLERLGFGDHRLKFSLRQFGDGRGGIFAAQ